VLGSNAHYGQPVNPRAPKRVTGGSSCGAAAAVAAAMCDFALGSDTGGSVRVPASFTGLYGLRPSFGRIATEGATPMAPSYDAIGFLARDAELFRNVGRVLLEGERVAAKVERLILAQDLFVHERRAPRRRSGAFLRRSDRRCLFQSTGTLLATSSKIGAMPFA
jgi:amidase